MEMAQKRMALIGAIDPLLPEFEDVAGQIRRLDDAEVTRRYDALKQIDGDTDYEVVIVGEDHHFNMT